MAGNYFCVRIGHGQDFLLSRDISGHTAPEIQVNERKQAVKQNVALVDNVDLGKMNDGVAVRVSMWHMEDMRRMSVEVKSHGIGKRDLR